MERKKGATTGRLSWLRNPENTDPTTDLSKDYPPGCDALGSLLFHPREGVASMTAILPFLSVGRVRLCTRRVMLFDVSSYTDLAGRSGYYPLYAT